MRHLFIFGVTSRSGTNYLSTLITRHPRFFPSKIYEDRIFENIGHLEAFISHVRASQGAKDWGRLNDLRKGLGAGISKYLLTDTPAQGDDFVLVTHSPTPDGSYQLPHYLPNAKAVFIVRDPRDIAVSAAISFGIPHSYTYSRWESAVRLIEELRNEPWACVVRYESLVGCPEIAVPHIWAEFGFSDYSLEFQPVPLAELLNVPVKGSSDLVKRGLPLDWTARPATPDFQPVGRWKREGVTEPPAGLREVMERWGYV